MYRERRRDPTRKLTEEGEGGGDARGYVWGNNV